MDQILWSGYGTFGTIIHLESASKTSLPFTRWYPPPFLPSRRHLPGANSQSNRPIALALNPRTTTSINLGYSHIFSRRHTSTSVHFHVSSVAHGSPFKSELASQAQEQAKPSSVRQQYGVQGFWSVVIPTYNRLPILTKCLEALEKQVGFTQVGVQGYEVVVVDDGSTDGTVEFLSTNRRRFPMVQLLTQQHAGATAARNLGIAGCRGATIIFIDSDMVVVPEFLSEHAKALREAYAQDGDDRAFTYGRVVNTANFDDPQSEPFKVTDLSAAFFATGNVGISRRRLLDAAALLGEGAEGPFDADFSEYGWEDLELGERLRQRGARIVQCPTAVGFHYHPAFSCDQIPKLIEQERQRGRNGVRFYRKHPNLNVRLMIQMTPFHEALWFLLTLGGLLNETSLEPLLSALVKQGQWQVAAGLLSPVLNWHTVQAVKEEARRMRAQEARVRSG